MLLWLILSHCFIYTPNLEDAKEDLKRALTEHRGSILMVCHEPEFYEGLVTKVWDCSQ